MTDEAVTYIYRTSICLRNGKRIFAHQFGLKAFRLKIWESPNSPSSSDASSAQRKLWAVFGDTPRTAPARDLPPTDLNFSYLGLRAS